MKLALWLALALFPAIVLAQTQECTNGRVFSACGTSCPLTCDNYQNPPLFCTLNCVIGCFCPAGLVEQGEGCVAPEDCSTATVATVPPTPQCAAGMVYETCGTACPLTCDNVHNPPTFCTFQCVQGCFCPSGMAQHNGGCVAPSDCPAATTTPVTTPVPTRPPPTPPTCTNGMIHETCGTACPLTCQNRNDPPRPCPLICAIGCFCPAGMAEYQGSCYAPDDCPDTATATVSPTTVQTLPPFSTQPPPTCTNGRIYSQCGTACPLTCDNVHNPPAFCTFQCVQGCFCPSGMVQHNGGCVAPSDCPAATTTPVTTTPTTRPPPTCANGMIHETCGTACPLTCQNRNDPPRPCPLICVIGCFCPRGMAEYQGSCYAPDDCPDTATATVPPTTVQTLPPFSTQPPPTCTNGRIYNQCGTACPLTCEHPNPRPCPRICAPGCFCPNGLLQNGDQCVTRDQCPTPTPPPTPPPTPACTNGMIYETCGTACPLTCANRHNPPAICPAICRIGCFCPSGMAEYQGSCYQPDDCPIPATTTVVATQPTAASTQPPPTCTNNMIYETCGTACPLTCANRHNPPAICPAICVIGCFCPSGMAEYQGTCYQPDNCPIPATATVTPTTQTVQTLPPFSTQPPPTCTNGRIYNQCGTACPLTCEHPNPRPCIRICAPGCFCPNGLLQNGDQCVTRDQCPTTEPPTPDCSCGPNGRCDAARRCICNVGWVGENCDQRVTTPPPTSPPPMECPAGREYRECGPVCRPSCARLNGCFSLRCTRGCFCPEGQFEHEGGCVSECPAVDPCQNLQCRDDQVCSVLNGRPVCKNPPYVPCGRDAFLACDSEWTYCLQQNKTRRAQCVSSCLSRNGNCDSDSTCITTANDDGRTSLQCLSASDLPKDCPAGQVMNECGNQCQQTCEQHLTGLPSICPAICGPPACTCPQGLVLFRDRCVDPRLCYVLVQHPPAIQPLPVVDPNTVMLSLRSYSMNPDFFRPGGMHRQMLLQSIQNALGFADVQASVHGVYNDSQGMQIVVVLSGSSIDGTSAQALANILSGQNLQLNITIQQIEPVDVKYVPQTEPEESEGLSRDAIIGIAVSSGVAGLAVVVAWVAVVMCCCVLNERKRRRVPPPAYQTSQSEYPLDDKMGSVDVVMDTEKGKLVMESLYY